MKTYVASPQVQERLLWFISELQSLLDRLGFELKAEDSEILIKDRRDSRPAKVQRDWPEVATLHCNFAGRLRAQFAQYELDEETKKELQMEGLYEN